MRNVDIICSSTFTIIVAERLCMCNYNEHSYLVIYRPNLQLISTIQEIRLGHNLQSLSITAVTQLGQIGETQENCPSSNLVEKDAKTYDKLSSEP